MLSRFTLDPQAIDFANKIVQVLDKIEDGVITKDKFEENLKSLGTSPIQGLSLGFLFTHCNFYKKDLKTLWSLTEILDIIKANPNMLDFIPHSK